MTIRVGKINGKNLNYLDHDVSSLDYALVNQGIIEGMNVTTGFVEPGRALVAVTRTTTTPHQKFLVHVEVLTREAVDTSGNKKIWIEVNKNYINDGTLATNPNGTEIARIMTGANYPWSDVFYLPLASVTGGVIADERKSITMPKVPQWRAFSHTWSLDNLKTTGLYETRWVNNTGWTLWFVQVISHIANENWCVQIAYRAELQFEILSRKMEGGWWSAWQKIYPISAEALDINGLTETNVAHDYHFFPIKEWNGINKKVTLEVLKKWLAQGYGTKNTQKATWWGRGEWNSQSIAVPRGGIASINTFLPNGGNANVQIAVQHSDNNSTFNDVLRLEFLQAGSVMIPPGFVKIYSYSSDYVNRSYSIQIF